MLQNLIYPYLWANQILHYRGHGGQERSNTTRTRNIFPIQVDPRENVNTLVLSLAGIEDSHFFTLEKLVLQNPSSACYMVKTKCIGGLMFTSEDMWKKLRCALRITNVKYFSGKPFNLAFLTIPSTQELLTRVCGKTQEYVSGFILPPLS